MLLGVIFQSVLRPMAYQKPQVTSCKLKDSEQASKLETVMGKLLHLMKSNYGQLILYVRPLLHSSEVILCDVWPGATQGSPETGLT